MTNSRPGSWPSSDSGRTTRLSRWRPLAGLYHQVLAHDRRAVLQGHAGRREQRQPQLATNHRQHVQGGRANRRFEVPAGATREIDDLAALIDNHRWRGVVLEQDMF